jgi:thioredoxin
MVIGNTMQANSIVVPTNRLRALVWASIVMIASANAATAQSALNPGTVNHFTPGADLDSIVIPQSRLTPVVVDFYATWCGPCKRLAPVLDQLAQEFSGQLTIIRVDISRNFDDPVSTRFNVKSIPLLVVIRKDQSPGLVSGTLPIAELREIFRSYLLESPVSNAKTTVTHK